MNNQTNPDEFLLGASVPSASFTQYGDTCKGVLVAKDVRQITNFETRQPEFWDNGSPKLQLVLTVETDERDPEILYDDGRRRIYAPKNNKDGSLFRAVGDAVRASGGGLELGGILAVQFVGEEEPEKRGRSPRKLYRAQFVQPAHAAADDLINGAPTQVAQTTAAQPTVHTAPVAAAPTESLI